MPIGAVVLCLINGAVIALKPVPAFAKINIIEVEQQISVKSKKQDNRKQ
jgi:hypothetical protein